MIPLKKHKILIILLISGFLLFFLNMKFQLNTFGKYLSTSDLSIYHGIIMSPPEKMIWKRAYEFKSDSSVKNLLNYEYRYHFLPSHTLGVMSKIFNIEFYDNDSNIDIKNLNFFLTFQIIIYYFSITVFYFKLIKLKFSEIIIYTTVGFLIFEPSINQFSSTIFGETIFFSILILCLSYLIDLPKENFKYFFFGLLVAALYLQRSVAFLFIIIPIIIILFKYKKKSLVKLFNLFVPLFLVFMILGTVNFNRSNVFYFLPTQTVDSLYVYFLPKVHSKIFKISEDKSKIKLKENKMIFAANNNLDLNKEIDRIKFYHYQKSEALRLLMNNKIITLKTAMVSSLHSMLLNPAEIINTRIKGKDYYKSKLHQKTILYRIFYSFLIYFIILIGFIYSFKKRHIEPHVLLLASVYFFIFSSWIGYTRYFVPSLLPLCLYFGIGLSLVINYVKKSVSINK